jgi:hypothetical protein
MNKCKKHPKYKAKMRPRVICSDCADIYKNKTGKDYLIFLKEKMKNIKVLSFLPTLILLYKNN